MSLNLTVETKLMVTVTVDLMTAPDGEEEVYELAKQQTLDTHDEWSELAYVDQHKNFPYISYRFEVVK